MQQKPLLKESITAAAAIAAHVFVGYDNATSGAAERALGVSDYAAEKAGDVIAVNVIGTAKVYSGGAFNRGDLLKTEAAGKAVAQAGVGIVVATALQDAAGADELVEVLLMSGFLNPAV